MAVKFRRDQIPKGLAIIGDNPELTTEDFIRAANQLPVRLIEPKEGIELNVCPLGKPRMTQRDTWKKRPAVMRYREACDQFRAECARWDYSIGQVFEATFVLPMPQSWSKKQKAAALGQPHLQKPDCDNIVKFCLDAGLSDDASVHTIRVNKIWGEEGKIIIYP